VGDVGYLFLKYQAEYGMPPQAMREKLGEAINISSRCNFSMSDAVEMKLIRNSAKYPDVFADPFSDYEQGRALSRSLWEAMGGDKTFYQWYGGQL
jgi:hypothetical protein